MSSWGDAKIFFCILFITCCCTVTVAQIVMDCCLSVRNQTVDKRAIVDHHHQITGQGCSLDAMILMTRRKIKLCVPADEPWVLDVVKHVEDKKKRCMKTKKARGCKDMTRV
ncbi:C-C motif chemokine 19-like precursor [Larimichthys crocea]|uniref:Chemokine CC-like protein n=1 Tax=Larimichthys crocea TaxID=215358 RepID=Q1PD40_LARCR|nr:C-C motif chemokine 19-like precursor [Larimichthys crocea]ABE02826.1 chemokine CC-like protein [Larimichthys crocea]